MASSKGVIKARKQYDVLQLHFIFFPSARGQHVFKTGVT